jgi:hypothetical protein
VKKLYPNAGDKLIDDAFIDLINSGKLNQISEPGSLLIVQLPVKNQPGPDYVKEPWLSEGQVPYETVHKLPHMYELSKCFLKKLKAESTHPELENFINYFPINLKESAGDTGLSQKHLKELWAECYSEIVEGKVPSKDESLTLAKNKFDVIYTVGVHGTLPEILLNKYFKNKKNFQSGHAFDAIDEWVQKHVIPLPDAADVSSALEHLTKTKDVVFSEGAYSYAQSKQPEDESGELPKSIKKYKKALKSILPEETLVDHNHPWFYTGDVLMTDKGMEPIAKCFAEEIAKHATKNKKDAADLSIYYLSEANYATIKKEYGIDPEVAENLWQSCAENVDKIKKQYGNELPSEKNLKEALAAMKTIGIGEKVGGCKVEKNLKDVQAGPVAYCQGVIATAGEEADAKLILEGKSAVHNMKSQKAILVQATNYQKTDLDYMTETTGHWFERLDKVDEILRDIGFDCVDKSPKLECSLKVTTPEDMDKVRTAALFLSSIDAVNKLPVVCIPKALNAAKKLAIVNNKWKEPWKEQVIPADVKGWMESVCNK